MTLKHFKELYNQCETETQRWATAWKFLHDSEDEIYLDASNQKNSLCKKVLSLTDSQKVAKELYAVLPINDFKFSLDVRMTKLSGLNVASVPRNDQLLITSHPPFLNLFHVCIAAAYACLVSSGKGRGNIGRVIEEYPYSSTYDLSSLNLDPYLGIRLLHEKVDSTGLWVELPLGSLTLSIGATLAILGVDVFVDEQYIPRDVWIEKLGIKTRKGLTWGGLVPVDYEITKIDPVFQSWLKGVTYD